MNKLLCSGAFKPISRNLWITWEILDACNYSCEYCPIKSNKYASKDILDETIEFIQNIKNRNIEITLFGGEPTLHKNLKYIVENLYKISNVRIFTNLSADSLLYNKLFFDYSCKYSISFHPDQVSSDKFLEKISHIDKKSIGFINIMDIEKYSIDIENVLQYLRNNGIKHRLCPIHGIGNKSEFLKSILYSKKYKNTNFYDTEIVYNNTNRNYTEQEIKFYNLDVFKGYICYKGYSSFFIDYRGNIYKCQNDIKFNNSLSITDSYSKIFSIEKSCPYDRCICEQYIPKEISFGYCNKYLHGLSNV